MAIVSRLYSYGLGLPLLRLRFGDFVAICDANTRHGPAYRQARITSASLYMAIAPVLAGMEPEKI